MSKIRKKFWEIFEKIVRDLESFMFVLFLNLLFIIVSEDSSSRLTGFFSKKIKRTYIHSVAGPLGLMGRASTMEISGNFWENCTRFVVYIVSKFTIYNWTEKIVVADWQDFSRRKKSTSIHSVSKEKKFENPSRPVHYPR